MIDAHVHVGRDNGRAIGAGRLGEQAIRLAFEAYAALGITAIRDGGDFDLEHVAIARAIAAEFGIIYKTPLFALGKRGGYGAIVGREIEKDDFAESLNELRRRGADFVKIMQSGIVDLDVYGEVSVGGFTREELRILMDFAHDMGFKVMVHCNGERLVDMAIEAGAESIEHGYFIGRQQLLAMRENGVIWTPTFVPFSNYVESGSASEHRNEVLTKTLKIHEENLREALSLGVRVAVGSDAGASYVRHGYGAFEELEYFVRFGGVSHEEARSLAEINGSLSLFSKL